jgi:hypothetical protein
MKMMMMRRRRRRIMVKDNRQFWKCYRKICFKLPDF